MTYRQSQDTSWLGVCSWGGNPNRRGYVLPILPIIVQPMKVLGNAIIDNIAPINRYPTAAALPSNHPSPPR